MKHHHPWFTGKLCAGLALWLGVYCAPAARGADTLPATGDANHPFRLAFMSSMFSEVNEADARAAMKIWIMTVAKERNIAVDPDPHIYSTLGELTASIRTNPIDGVGMVASEYARLSRVMKFDRLGVGDYGGNITEKYLLLVRSDSGIERLDQLQGRTLNVLNTPRTSLATVWLDTALLESGLKRCTVFFSQINYNNKASLVTLPVYFHQADACLTTSNSFKVMGELNPQLTKQLRALAVSPEVMPACFAFCASDNSPARPQILKEMTRMGETPAGKQILTLVKSDGIVEAPLSCMDSSLELLARHDRLCGETNQARVATK